VELEDAVDAALQQDVVVAGHHAYLQTTKVMLTNYNVMRSNSSTSMG
jgi:hypothetical protein